MCLLSPGICFFGSWGVINGVIRWRVGVIMRTEQPTGCFGTALETEGDYMRVGLVWVTRWFVAGRSGVVVLLWFSVACFWYRSFDEISACVCSCCFWFSFGCWVATVAVKHCYASFNVQ